MKKIRIFFAKIYMMLPMTILMVMLAGCGFHNGTSTTTNAGSPAPTTTATTAVSTTKPGGTASIMTAQGCPSNTIMGNAPRANVTVRLSGNRDQTVSATNGDIIELRFPFGKKWSGPTTTSGPLQLQTPAGYALQSDKSCVWRFNTRGTGTTELHFSARPLCKMGQMCALFIQDVPVTVIVK
ncbi:hypothetical protein [Dictyobacter arantiisoli]|uniref:hypothetical protein n=1 Tax=Dictyobacter arantiisoli TaxID=2014874 RepID=UPI0011ED2F7A|nr:hypothetical protein [Dictyobacter arantiisoli]